MKLHPWVNRQAKSIIDALTESRGIEIASENKYFVLLLIILLGLVLWTVFSRPPLSGASL